MYVRRDFHSLFTDTVNRQIANGNLDTGLLYRVCTARYATPVLDRSSSYFCNLFEFRTTNVLIVVTGTVISFMDYTPSIRREAVLLRRPVSGGVCYVMRYEHDCILDRIVNKTYCIECSELTAVSTVLTTVQYQCRGAVWVTS